MSSLSPSSSYSLAKRVLPALPIALAAVPSADAVILSGPLDITVTPGNTIYFDLDQSSSTLASTTSFDGHDVMLHFDSYGETNLRPKVQITNGSGGVAMGPNLLALNTLTGLTTPPAGTDWGSKVYLNNTVDENSANWALGTTGYLSLRLTSDGGTNFNYGWAEVTYGYNAALLEGAGSNYLQLHAFGYEPPAAIPEPSTTAALFGATALVAGSVAAHRRRQKTKAA